MPHRGMDVGHFRHVLILAEHLSTNRHQPYRFSILPTWIFSQPTARRLFINASDLARHFARFTFFSPTGLFRTRPCHVRQFMHGILAATLRLFFPPINTARRIHPKCRKRKFGFFVLLIISSVNRLIFI